MAAEAKHHHEIPFAGPDEHASGVDEAGRVSQSKETDDPGLLSAGFCARGRAGDGCAGYSSGMRAIRFSGARG